MEVFIPPPPPPVTSPVSPRLMYDDDDSYADTSSIDYYNKMDYMNHGDSEMLSTEDESDLTINSNGGRASRIMEKVRREHGCYFLKKRVKNYFLKVVCFATKSTPLTPIRHAVTGKVESGFYVGRKDEDAFFKVRIMSGELKERSEFGNDFYYYSPDEYCRHFQVEIPAIMKEIWEKKREQYMSSRNARHGKERKPEFTIVK